MAGGVRIGVAWDDVALEPEPTWQYLTDDENLVASYEIDRGGADEFDHSGPATADVTIWDTLGLLNPANSGSPFFGKIDPGVQIQIELLNPVTDEWCSRFRGWIDEYDYDVQEWVYQDADGSTKGVTALKLECIGIRETLEKIEMFPGAFGNTPPLGSEGQVFFEDKPALERVTQVLTNAGIGDAFQRVFTLNVEMQESTYSPGETVNQVIQDVADAEFPTLSNAYSDRFGRLAIHGRFAKFDPEGTAAEAGAAWDFHHWKCGDEKAVRLSISDTAQIRKLAFNRGWKYVRNYALCTPNGIVEEFLPDQVKQDLVSIGEHGYAPWSAENLLIDSGTTTGNTDREECAMFAQYVVDNYATPRDRITLIEFRSMRPDDDRAAANWDLLTKVDIGDLIDVTAHTAGDGPTGYTFNAEPCFVEGVRETALPLNGEYADVTLNLDLSPQAYFATGGTEAGL